MVGRGVVNSQREKTELFARHLSQAFKPNPCSSLELEEHVHYGIRSDQQLYLHLKSVPPKETAREIRHLKNKKASGFHLMTSIKTTSQKTFSTTDHAF